MFRSSRPRKQAGYSVASALVFITVLGLTAVAIESAYPKYNRDALTASAVGGVLAQETGGTPEVPAATAAQTTSDLNKAKCEEKKKEAMANGGISKSSTQPFSASESAQSIMEKNRCIAAMFDKNSEGANLFVNEGLDPKKNIDAYKCIGETNNVTITGGGSGTIAASPNPTAPVGSCVVTYCDVTSSDAGGCHTATRPFSLNGYNNSLLGTPSQTPDGQPWEAGTPTPGGTTPPAGDWGTFSNPTGPLQYFGEGQTTPTQPTSYGEHGNPNVYTPELYGPPLPPGWDPVTGQPAGSGSGIDVTGQTGGLNQGGLSGDAAFRQAAGLPPAGSTTAPPGSYTSQTPCGLAGLPGCQSPGSTFPAARPGGILGGGLGGSMGGYQQPSLLSSFFGGLTQGLMQGLLGTSAYGGMAAQACSTDPTVYAQQQQQYQLQMQQYQMQMQQLQYQQQMQQYSGMGGQYGYGQQGACYQSGFPYQSNLIVQPVVTGCPMVGYPTSMGYGQGSLYGGYGMPQMPQPCTPGGTNNGGLLGNLLNGNSNNSGNSGNGGGNNGGNSNGNKCPTPPAQPAGSECTVGYWKAVYSGVCLTNWQCTAVDQLRAEISCQPNVADAGMTLAISYACTSGTASSDAFHVTSQPSGTATTTVATPPIGANTATYNMTCTDGARTAVAQCSIQVANPTIAFTASPASVQASSTAVLGWVTSGMKSCVVSSASQPDFTSRNASMTAVNGTAVSSPITSTTTFLLECETQAGGTRSATTSVSVAP